MTANNNPFDINKATALQANHRYFELADYCLNIMMEINIKDKLVISK